MHTVRNGEQAKMMGRPAPWDGSAVHTHLVIFYLQAPLTLPFGLGATSAPYMFPNWRVLKVGLANPTPIHYLGTDHSERYALSLCGQILDGRVGAS